MFAVHEHNLIVINQVFSKKNKSTGIENQWLDTVLYIYTFLAPFEPACRNRTLQHSLYMLVVTEAGWRSGWSAKFVSPCILNFCVGVAADFCWAACLFSCVHPNSVSHLASSASCIRSSLTHYWSAHSGGCYLWRAPSLAPAPPLCSSPPAASSLDLTQPPFRHADGRPAKTGSGAGTAWKGVGFWFLPLCRRRQSRPHIFLRETGRRRGETRSPTGSHREGRRFEPDR